MQPGPTMTVRLGAAGANEVLRTERFSEIREFLPFFVG